MLDIFTVSFFGHRIVENFSLIESQVEKIIMDLLSEKEYVEFLVGRNGEFDQIVSSSIRRAKKNYRDDNCCHNLILPYETAIYHNNYDYFNNYYDQVDIFKKSNSHFKAAIQERNKEMVNRSEKKS